MISKRIKVSIIILLVLSLSGLYAQEVITTAGGEGSGTGGSVSYSVGQFVYRVHPGTSGSLTEGVQQPYEISVVTGINEDDGIDLLVTAYPNPVNDFLVLRIDASALISYGQISYRLYDLQGKLIMDENIVGDITPVPMNYLAPGIYLLKVFESYATKHQRDIKTFKIIKTN